MDCEFTEKVSLLLDAELTETEALRVKEHIAACAACRQAEEDFLRLRRELKAYDFRPQPFAQAGMLARILDSERRPLWRRDITLPLPVLACLLALVVALAVWTVALRRAISIEQGKSAQEKSIAAPPSQPDVVEKGGVDFSRYDHGERAAIYKVRRAASATAPGARQ
jgi:predicted anti-sigma-YlaC factor YlaD